MSVERRLQMAKITNRARTNSKPKRLPLFPAARKSLEEEIRRAVMSTIYRALNMHQVSLERVPIVMISYFESSIKDLLDICETVSDVQHEIRNIVTTISEVLFRIMHLQESKIDDILREEMSSRKANRVKKTDECKT